MDEKNVLTTSGGPVLFINIMMYLGSIAIFVAGMVYGQNSGVVIGGSITAFIVILTFAIIVSFGFFSIQPNEARVLVLFGRYIGTERNEGFHWANPFMVKRAPLETVQQPGKPASVQSGENKYSVSLRLRNFETERSKVNDARGNPIEIGAVVVWRVTDTAKALFDVDNYCHYVKVQSESAVRHLANSYPYDHSEESEEHELTLRDNGEAVCKSLEKELQNRMDKAGVVIEEARITHLAYAPEIAGAMLRRQQAEAIIAARQKIVHGAVSMVEMALSELSEKKVVDLDEEKKAAMVSNLLVVLCGETEAQPVLNAGTLYH